MGPQPNALRKTIYFSSAREREESPISKMNGAAAKPKVAAEREKEPKMSLLKCTFILSAVEIPERERWMRLYTNEHFT